MREIKKNPDPSDLLPKRLVERSSGGDDLREAGGPREGPTELGPGAHIGDPMKSLGPPLVSLDAKPWHFYGIVHKQPDLLLQRQPTDQVPHPHVHRQRRPAEPQAPRQPAPGVARERRTCDGSRRRQEEE
ncbi:hypothetical protein TIFTF001_024343 [Ficus carica]|uniref:Uncharacterized protein n=1 Tax=Ficus carica TaxID=3494 RepID=A0AA88AVM6_FICCA|nr:hypothetical protein TIFTF001_024343 [Ficus carica]